MFYDNRGPLLPVTRWERERDKFINGAHSCDNKDPDVLFLFLSLWAASLRVGMGFVLGELELKSNFVVVICAFCFYIGRHVHVQDSFVFCWFVFRMDFYDFVGLYVFIYFFTLNYWLRPWFPVVFFLGLVQLVTINFRPCWNQRALDLKLFWAMKKSAFQSFVEFLFSSSYFKKRIKKRAARVRVPRQFVCRP